MDSCEKSSPIAETPFIPTPSLVDKEVQDSNQKQRFEDCLSRNKQDKHQSEHVDFPQYSEERNKILRIIVILLQTANPQLDWHAARPHLHRRLEEALFCNKQSMEAYTDVQTVQQRVLEHVTLIGQKVPHMELEAPPSREAESVPSIPPPLAVGLKQSRKRTPEELLRQQQQRLLLLQHVMECPVTDEAVCPTTPLCASMKKVWDHIIYCKSPQCTAPHCRSSRYVLSHHCDCKNSACRMCAPIREGRGLEWLDLPWIDTTTASSAATVSAFSTTSTDKRVGPMQGVSGVKAGSPMLHTDTRPPTVGAMRGRSSKCPTEPKNSFPDNALQTPERVVSTKNTTTPTR